MADSTNYMDFSVTSKSERFRTPFSMEKQLGLWVDRIGQGIDNSSDIRGMRILGLYGAVFIEKGNGVFRTGSCGEFRTYRGTVMLLFPDEPHRYMPETSWKTRWIVWGGPEAEVLEQSGYAHRSSPVVRDAAGSFIQAFDKLELFMNQEDTGSALLRKTVLLSLIHGLYIQSQNRTGQEEYTLRIRDAVTLIQNNIAFPPSIPELAAAAKMSETNFRRLFRKITGRAPSRFIISLKMSEAKRLLAMGRSIQEAALALGYEDMFYFMRVFKREVGIPPGRFTKQVSGNV